MRKINNLIKAFEIEKSYQFHKNRLAGPYEGC